MRATRRSPPASAGTLAAITSVVMWGSGNVLVKYIRLDGMAIAFNRLWLGSVLFSALLIVLGGRITWSSLRIAAPGGIAFALDLALFFTAIKHTSVADASIITALQPALLFLVAGRLFGEKVYAATVGWTLVAIGGVTVAVLASASSAGRTVEGDLVALASLVAWAWYFVASKQARQQLGALEYQAALSVIAAVMVTPLALMSSHHLVVSDVSTFGWIMLMVVVPGGGHLIMNWAHEYAPITLVSMVTLGIPVIATIGAAVVLGEAVTVTQGAGMVVVILALAMVLRRPPVVGITAVDAEAP